MAQLNVYLVDAATPTNPRPTPKKLETATIAADGDVAQAAARTMLEGNGYVVRSINWGPNADPHKPHVLHAYVMNKGVS